MTRYELTTPFVRDTLIRFAVVPWFTANWPVRDTVFLLFFRHYRLSGFICNSRRQYEYHHVPHCLQLSINCAVTYLLRRRTDPCYMSTAKTGTHNIIQRYDSTGAYVYSMLGLIYLRVARELSVGSKYTVISVTCYYQL